MTTTPIYIARGLKADGRVEFEFVITGQGKPKKRFFSLDKLAAPAKEFYQWLGEHNILVTPQVKQDVQALIENRPQPRRGFFAAAPGWHGRSFVTPREIYGPDSRLVANLTPSDSRLEWGRKGELDEFNRWADENFSKSPVAIFAMALAFAGPILRWTDHKSIVAMLVGGSSQGKSTLQQIAGALWGGNDGNGYVETFLKSPEAFEEAALRHRDCLLVLDEMKLIDRNEVEAARKFESLLFRFDSGVRKTIYGKATVRSDLRGTFLLSSNETAATILGKAGREVTRELAARILEIPVDPDFPVFHLDESDVRRRAMLVEKIRREARQVYGVARHQFLKRLTEAAATETEEARLVDRISKLRRIGLKLLGLPQVSSEIDSRLAGQVAIVYAAGRLAYAYDALPFDKYELREAIRVVWPRILASAMSGLRRSALSEFVANVLHVMPTFVNLGLTRPKDMGEVLAAPGFVKSGPDDRVTVWLTTAALRRFTALPKAVLEALEKEGILQRELKDEESLGKRQVKLTLGKRLRPRVYKLHARLEQFKKIAAI